MITYRLIGIIFLSFFLTNLSIGQSTAISKVENIPLKTIGLIDAENIYNPEQEKYIDSVCLEFYKKTSIRTVVITSDTSSRFSLFTKVRNLWGYTDTEIRNDFVIVLSTTGVKRFAFFDDWIYNFLGSEKVNKIVNDSWEEFVSGFYFEALNQVLKKLHAEIEKKLK